MDISKAWVIAVISNPVRYESRYRLFEEFVAKLPQGTNLLIVEQAFGDRPFRITKRNHHHHLQVRTFDELWHKENMINLGVQYLSRIDPTWEYVAWVDADVQFVREDWLLETVHKLQHHMFVQLFQTAVDLGPSGEALKIHTGFAWNYIRGHYGKHCVEQHGHGYNYIGHPGYAWACRREAFDAIGGLVDVSIMGAGDHHMALALVGRVEVAYPKDINITYKLAMKLWQDRAEKHIRRDIGFVAGSILHGWHGKKRDRNYGGRWQILIKNNFCPLRDLHRDAYGLWQLDPDRIALRDDIRAYFRSRNEDSIDVG